METFQGYQKNVECNDDGTPMLNTPNNEKLYATFNDVTLKFNNETHGNGTVYVTTGRLIWIASQNKDLSYGFPLISMVLHAISKDKKLCETPCIFIQLQGDDDEGDIPVVIFAPQHPENVEMLFDAISKMNELIEPPEQESEDDSDIDDGFDDADVEH
ncbi:Nucleotide-sensitive chloride conductance regulator family protein [Babesia bovis T2Bo]|uniref:Nucleotide-sensitive chloride conductance regulator family protein n=1 Tax=Babesia bovis T2Bo TaxID=484906 RepID=UPI001C359ABD|nr:Nucleotide-sensitive chloride conductance regulator family protein [Babesia bovis T2Bo]KAG6440061.1 Nucleotide-sensitive chloride conductance regulator family protein [Babesia bovis T2Bo]